MEKKGLDTRHNDSIKKLDTKGEEPLILEKIEIEELFIDGICGFY